MKRSRKVYCRFWNFTSSIHQSSFKNNLRIKCKYLCYFLQTKVFFTLSTTFIADATEKRSTLVRPKCLRVFYLQIYLDLPSFPPDSVQRSCNVT